MKFGRLTVLRVMGAEYVCQCDCGTIKTISKYPILSGKTKSCGCLKAQQLTSRNVTHGQSKTDLYSLWKRIKNRVFNKRSQDFKDYGGRGIEMCPQWVDNFDAFKKYIQEVLGDRPSKRHSLDRIDNEKGYIPGNLRWATQTEQANNTRKNICLNTEKGTTTLARYCADNNLPYLRVWKELRKGNLGNKQCVENEPKRCVEQQN